MRNSMIISKKEEEIILKINGKTEQQEIIEEIEQNIEKIKEINKEKLPIKIVGKVLKNTEIEEIEQIIKQKIQDTEIIFESPKILGLHVIKKAFEKEIITSETKFYSGDLRSGQKIEFDGSLVIIGDVNGGAEIIAGENIIILGILRGLAHAGAKGNKKAIITASELEAPQIRISNIVKELTEEEYQKTPTQLYIEANEIQTKTI